jgi:hypothetical protein
MENLSTDQLLNYIKKQKAKIKQLEIENEELLKTNQKFSTLTIPDNNDESKLFWRTVIQDTNSFKSRVGRSVMSNFIHILSKKLKGKNDHDLKTSFLIWKTSTIEKRAAAAVAAAEEAKENLQQSEQRITKLKALLARTHQSKQVN